MPGKCWCESRSCRCQRATLVARSHMWWDRLCTPALHMREPILFQLCHHVHLIDPWPSCASIIFSPDRACFPRYWRLLEPMRTRTSRTDRGWVGSDSKLGGMRSGTSDYRWRHGFCFVLESEIQWPCLDNWIFNC